MSTSNFLVLLWAVLATTLWLCELVKRARQSRRNVIIANLIDAAAKALLDKRENAPFRRMVKRYRDNPGNKEAKNDHDKFAALFTFASLLAMIEWPENGAGYEMKDLLTALDSWGPPKEL